MSIDPVDGLIERGVGTAAAEATDPGRVAIPTLVLAIAAVTLFAPVFFKLSQTVWNTDEQGHGPIIIAVSLWLAWSRRERLGAWVRSIPKAGGVLAWSTLVVGLLTYLVGRVQSVATFEMGSIVPTLVGLVAAVYGWRTVGILAFPIFFLLFAVPLPGAFVDFVTQPLKQSVSWVAENVLYAVGYPIARTGVILKIGQYQLLVADACAGLNSMFTLEALGLLYMNLVGHVSRLRNALLAVLIIPMSFIANVIRVMALVLVTYHFGDEAGQGLVHGAAGMILFGVALLLMFLMDGALGRLFGPTGGAR